MKVEHYVSGGEIRCVQSAFRMVVTAFVGVDPGEEAADRMTGYEEGKGTWQFRMLLSLAQYGLRTTDHEKLYVAEFVNSPADAIRRQVVEEEAIRLIIKETDIESEKEALILCLESPLIRFIDEVPSFEDLRKEVSLGKLVMVNVNLQVLKNKPHREGHILIIEEIDNDKVVVHDPGPNGGLRVVFGIDLFQKAWASPSENMKNYISVEGPAGS